MTNQLNTEQLEELMYKSLFLSAYFKKQSTSKSKKKW